MRLKALATVVQALAVCGIRVIQSNDDGWAELYVRSLNDALLAADHDVLLSAPADNKSGTGSLDKDPTDRSKACEYDSCPADSGSTGTNATRSDLHWVNSYPVTSIRYGIDDFAPQLWDGAAPQLALTGPNVGSNIMLEVPISGTVGAAAYAVHEAGIPAIAFSGADDDRLAWDTQPVPLSSTVYAQLAMKITDQIIGSGTPYLPDDVFLNVNFPSVTGGCTEVSEFKWVLSRIYAGALSPPDVEWCGSERLPTESHVHGADGCYISVSIGDAADKTDVNDVDRQAVVLDKLQDMLTCLS